MYHEGGYESRRNLSRVIDGLKLWWVFNLENCLDTQRKNEIIVYIYLRCFCDSGINLEWIYFTVKDKDINKDFSLLKIFHC